MRFPTPPNLTGMAGWEKQQMQERDIDQQIKNYRQKIEQLYAIDDHIRALEIERFGGSRTEFHSPSDDQPMQTALYLSFLDTTLLVEAMKPFYKRPKSIRYLGSMGLTFVFMKITEQTPDKVANYLKTHPPCAELLGYQRDKHGVFIIPDGETIRFNQKKRFGIEGIKSIDRVIRVAMSKRAKELGINLGDCCGSDAFPIKSVKSDKQAEYNGHYETPGYKVAMTESYGMETGIVPLTGQVLGINDDEGKTLIPQLRELKTCDIHVKQNWVDNKYATIENIQHAEIIEGTILQYNPAKNWIYDHNATPEQIKQDYQKFHNEPDFQPGAPLDFMMRYLVKKGHGETVGYMLRNDHIAAKEECPDGYLDHFHKRNITESENDYIKNDKGLQKAIRRKGKDYIELQLQLTLLALHVVALVRLQNNVESNLVSTRGFT
jgi:hypothetical protein